MANPEHLDILKQGVEIWNQWRKDNPDVVPDLCESNLLRADLNLINLHGAYLEGIFLGGAKLNGATLSETNLSAATLFEATLFGTNLHGATLYGANLHRANLCEADLNQTHLGGADLSMADLSKAQLYRADLGRVNLWGANLGETDLSWATCHSTIFANVDLSTVKGLDTINHIRPSTLGIDTLFRSKGKIPEKFMRGCGVPKNLITYLSSLFSGAVQFYSCFISYSHTDAEFAGRLEERLQKEGILCWRDTERMNPGDDIYEEIQRGVQDWDKVLLCCSQSSLAKKWWVDHEIDSAFQKERELFKERGQKVLVLIPLDLDGYLFDPKFASGKGQQIRSRVAANFKGWEDDDTIFEREIKRVIKALRIDGGNPPPPEPKLKPQ
ncbi:MAG: toll/interleukin-1 receptor domain-containing protein [Anaerolineaceae bacterium]|nr:toll/interleukin-1 receptor domain-containing protein [Anaerolineaceae bacterium]